MKNSNVVVTGAGGSIGSQFCERVIAAGARKLTLISLTESGLYNVERRLRAMRSSARIVGILGSVCDRELMVDACQDADIVIHAAAHKHVPICEENPIAAIENNVRGTLMLAEAADLCEVNQFLLVSTDKAVRPVSVMGATKRTAELIVANKASSSRRTRFTTVRFGNVLDSAGSVLPLWREQIANGLPITITDERCERFFMSIPEACELMEGVLGMEGSGTFVFDMGEPRKLIDMARNLIVASGLPCEIEIIGLRPGEKLTEELHAGGTVSPTSNPKIFRVDEPLSLDWRRSMLRNLLEASACRKTALALDLLREITHYQAPQRAA
jgi:FlaA1/EpsC-like NDP-sugar epimerase